VNTSTNNAAGMKFLTSLLSLVQYFDVATFCTCQGNGDISHHPVVQSRILF
jgi:hypothetical protein